MGIESTLLTVVTSIVVWAVQRENGGVFNVLLCPIHDRRNETDFELVKDILQSATDFVIPMILHRNVPLPVLGALPASLGGGPQGVVDAQANPNREPAIFWCTIGVFVVSIVVIIAIQAINCGCYDDLHDTPSGMYDGKDGIFGRSSGERGQLICKIGHLVLFVIALAFGVACIITIGVFFASIGLAVNHLKTQPNTTNTTSNSVTSLPSGLRVFADSIGAFLADGLSEGQIQTNRTLHAFLTTTENEITDGIGNTIDNILIYLKISDILAKGQALLTTAKSFHQLGNETSSGLVQLKSKIDSTMTSLNAVKSQFATAFASLPICIRECEKLRNEIAALSLPIDPTSLGDAGIESFLVELEQFIKDTDDQLNRVEDGINRVKDFKDETVQSVSRNLNLTGHIASVNDMWARFTPQTDAIKSQVDAIVTSIETALPTYGPYISIGLYVIGGLFCLMFVTAFVIFIHLVVRAVKIHIHRFSGQKSEKLAKRDAFCGKVPVCCCSSFFIPILLVFTILTAVLLFLLTFVAGETCIYIVRDSAIKKTDFVLNGMLVNRWPSLVGNDHSSQTTTGSLSDVLNLPAPRDVLRALTHTCKPSSQTHVQGFLAAVGYTNLLNVEKLFDSPVIQEGIRKGETAFVKRVIGLKISEKIPTGAQTDTLLVEISNFNISATLEELNTTRLDTVAMEKIVNSTKRVDYFLNTAPPGTDDLARANVEMKALLTILEDLKPGLTEIRTKLEEINSQKQTLITPVQALITSVEASRALVQEVALSTAMKLEYKRLTTTIITFLKAETDTGFAKLTVELFPCANAYIAVKAATDVTCGYSGIINSLTGIIYILALTTLFITLFYFSLFNMAFVQAMGLRELVGVN